MNVAGIVVWGILLGASFTFVNTAGVFMLCTPPSNLSSTGYMQYIQTHSACLQSSGSPEASSAVAYAGCQVSASGLPYNCTGNTNSPGDVISTAFTFGNFMWSFVSSIKIIMQGALVPGTLANQWFGGIGVVVNAGMMVLFALWAWAVVGNRRSDFTPE